MPLIRDLPAMVCAQLSFDLFPVRDFVHESKFERCRKQEKAINKIKGRCLAVRFKVLEMLLFIDQPFKQGQISVLI